MRPIAKRCRTVRSRKLIENRMQNINDCLWVIRF
jgi:hypothetical protein